MRAENSLTFLSINIQNQICVSPSSEREPRLLSVPTVLDSCSKMIHWEIVKGAQRPILTSQSCRKQTRIHCSPGACCVLNKACGCHHRYGPQTSQPAENCLCNHTLSFYWKQLIITGRLAAVVRKLRIQQRYNTQQQTNRNRVHHSRPSPVLTSVSLQRGAGCCSGWLDIKSVMNHKGVKLSNL